MKLIRIATSNPPYNVTQGKACSELKSRMATRPAIARMIDAAAAHSGIENRFIVVPDTDESIKEKFYSEDGKYFSPDTKTRMIEYEKWSKALSEEAVKKLVSEINYDIKNLKRLITISCTGFFAPGLDYHLISKFGLPVNIKRTNIGFMGCAAAIIGLNSVIEAMSSAIDDDQDTLLIALELCSLHLQTEPTRDNILANMIFADGCAAVLFSKQNHSGKISLQLLSTDSILFPDSQNFMGWKIGNNGFEMMLSSELPKIILNTAVPDLKNILKTRGINLKDVRHWALHPGGRAILDSLQNGLCLTDEEMIPSRKILRNYGNMSSPSILFVLKEILDSRSIQKDDLCCAVAFGPGLTMEVALLKGT